MKPKTIEGWECENCGKHHKSEDTICECQPVSVAAKQMFCKGCYNDEYNNGLGGAKKCWSLDKMMVIQRKRVHINDRPPWNHTPESLPKCYRVPKFAFINGNRTC